MKSPRQEKSNDHEPLLGPVPQDASEESDDTAIFQDYAEPCRNLIAFGVLGIVNNSSFVIMNAAATEISNGGVAIVYIVNQVPGFLVKLTGPYWFHLVPYKYRVIICCLLMSSSFCLVALSTTKELKLLGVALTSLQCSFGEASFLALSSFYDARKTLTSWSSGTGFAGVVGFAWSFVIHTALGFSFKTSLLMANILPVIMMLTYFFVLVPPWVDESRSRVTRGSRVLSVSDDDSRLLRGPAAAHPPEVDAEGASVVAGGMSCSQQLMFIVQRLWPYMIPLVLVYLSEYAIQAGVWASMGFPVEDQQARSSFYQAANWSYQAGVFISRSSGTLYQASRRTLWAMPAMQMGLLLFFGADALTQFWYNWGLLVPAFVVGLLGGAVYVNVFTLISVEIPLQRREFALSAASFGCDFGILIGDLLGLFFQACVFRSYNISGASVSCPL